MLADEVHDGHMCPDGVMQIRQTVGETGAKMQEGARRPFNHTRVAVRCPGANPLEQAEHAANFRLSVEGSDQMDL
jgi:hypothetical protein